MPWGLPPVHVPEPVSLGVALELGGGDEGAPPPPGASASPSLPCGPGGSSDITCPLAVASTVPPLTLALPGASPDICLHLAPNSGDADKFPFIASSHVI